jgi:predicted MPP superfamily phosphohydrolase
VGGRSVLVFHISDLHVRSMDGVQADRARLDAASRWRVLGEKWSANLVAIREDEIPVDLVRLTGDPGDWGNPTNYPRSLAFLTQTWRVLTVALSPTGQP